MEDTSCCFSGGEAEYHDVLEQGLCSQTARIQDMNHGALEGTS